MFHIVLILFYLGSHIQVIIKIVDFYFKKIRSNKNKSKCLQKLGNSEMYTFLKCCYSIIIKL